MLKAVVGVDFVIPERTTMGVIGESGCGKTTLGRCIVRAIDPTEGEINFLLPDNKIVNLTTYREKRAQSYPQAHAYDFPGPIFVVGSPNDGAGYHSGADEV